MTILKQHFESYVDVDFTSEYQQVSLSNTQFHKEPLVELLVDFIESEADCYELLFD
jgi:hypothetical protein